MGDVFGRRPDAVIFDLDGTLYDQLPVQRAMAGRIVLHHSVHPVGFLRTVKTLSAYRRAQEHLRATGFEGDVAAEQLAHAARRVRGAPSDVHVVVERWMGRAPLDLVARHRRSDVIELISDLAELRVPLGLVSDYPADAKLAALGLLERFDVIVTAQDPDVGVFKPHPRGLRVALERLGVSPERSCYVGDRLDVDLPAARSAGVSFLSVSRRGEPFELIHTPSATSSESAPTLSERTT